MQRWNGSWLAPALSHWPSIKHDCRPNPSGFEAITWPSRRPAERSHGLDNSAKRKARQKFKKKAMSGRVPHAAFCEEYDEDANVILPDTRRVANVAAKRSKTELRPAADGASDSGYSSRTAATVNSAQSGPSGRRSPAPLKVNTTLRGIDLAKIREIRESRKDKGKEKENQRPAMPGKMPVESLRSSTRVASHQRSPSKPKRRDSVNVRHHPGSCWECEQGLYHPSTPIDPRALDYPYYASQPPSVHDFPPAPPSPQSARYPPPYGPEIQIAQRGRRGSRSSSVYHPNGRPLSYHGMTPEVNMMYGMGTMTQYDRGPPPSASAYTNASSFSPSPYQQQLQYVPRQDSVPPSPYERQHEPFDSRARESKSRRRSSVYGPPVVNYAPSTPDYDDGEPLERKSSRDQRSSRYSQTFDRDEDYYLMPPPPVKQHKPQPPQVIQRRPDLPRKSATTGTTGTARRGSQTWDMSELEDALPDRPLRNPIRDAIIPERSQSLRGAHRRTSYHETSRPGRIAIEDSRRRRTSVYDYESQTPTRDLEDKARDAEEYQAARAGKPVPLTADALFKAKNSHRPDSDSGSQKSRSNSSRGSDARTRDGSGTGSKGDEEHSFTMNVNGITMSFSQESVGGKRINLKTGETGGVELNIEGRRPKKYITSRSDYTSTSGSGRREIEDRHSRDDRRSDRASRRSSRSTYSSRGLLE